MWTPVDPGLPAGATSRRPLQICIATPDIVGPVRNGGVGSAYTALAFALASAGHNVSILYALGPHCENGHIDDWVQWYAQRQVKLVPMPASTLPLQGPRGIRESHQAWQWLKTRSFDVIHFPEMTGLGFQSTQAKRLGLAFERTTLCVGLHSPTLWHLHANAQPLDDEGLLSADFMERESVAAADVVISPSNYLLGWASEAGWTLPQRTLVWPNMRPSGLGSTAIQSRSLDEIVFFGRLEARKGLGLFCEAIERLDKAGALKGRRVLFLGKDGRYGDQPGATFVRQRVAKWRVPWSINSALSQSEAVMRLCSPGVLAVMPSLADNSPNTVLECVLAGVPFVATNVGGIPEMLAPDDQAGCLVAPTANALASGIQRVLDGQRSTPRLAQTSDAVRDGWLRWHESLTVEPFRWAPKGDAPKVSVCIATRNRPGPLKEALASIRAQTYPRIEVVLVDDGGDDPAALDIYEQPGWKVIRSEQRFPGAARNLAASHATGDFLLFMDDDNIAKPEEVATFVKAAERSGVSLLTCASDTFRDGDLTPVARWLPLGPALPLGMFANVFGDTNMFIRRDTFRALGGFAEEQGAGLIEDWGLLARAALQKVPFACVPEPLFSYRLWSEGHGQRAAEPSNRQRALAPFLSGLPPAQAQVLQLAAGLRSRVRGAEQEASVAALSLRRRDERFLAATPLLFMGALDAKGLRILQHAEILPDNDGIKVVAHGIDPQLALPELALTGKRPLIRLDVTTWAPTAFDFFWTTFDEVLYGPERNATVFLQEGRQQVVVELPSSEIVGPIRFDPGPAEGTVLVHSLEVRTEKGLPIGPSKGQPSAQKLPWSVVDQARLEPTVEGLLIHSHGIDPGIELAMGNLIRRFSLVVLEIVAPAATRAQIFWMSPWHREYAEERSVTVWLDEGLNQRRVQMPDVAIFRLRFDPGQEPGDYLLRRFETEDR